MLVSPADLAPSCAEAGVLGVLPGIIGSLQALEAIKLLLDLGDPLIGRILSFDALELSFPLFIRAERTNGFSVEPGGNKDRSANSPPVAAMVRRVGTSIKTAAPLPALLQTR